MEEAVGAIAARAVVTVCNGKGFGARQYYPKLLIVAEGNKFRHIYSTATQLSTYMVGFLYIRYPTCSLSTLRQSKILFDQISEHIPVCKVAGHVTAWR